ncbi:hypothetical protein ACIG0D_27385 [Streptomyces sp. NPDC052773]|uniref:hypothetical protein n=1 Tax=Streptomyces sp. NPDC052773 TaxID=3365693 RepID=UPI0037CEE7BE
MDLSKGAAGPLVFKGHLASALLYPDRVEFKRRWVARLGGNRSGVVLLPDVLKVLRQDPTRFVNGYVHLLTAADGGRLRAAASDPVKAVAGNPRAIMFTWNQRDTFAKFVAAVEEALQRQRPQL